MLYHVVTKNGTAQWLEPSIDIFRAKKAAEKLNKFSSYGIFSYDVKSFWTRESAELFISKSIEADYNSVVS